MDRLPVLYDEDCGFCRATLGALLAIDREHRLRPVPLQGEEAERLLPGMSPEERLFAVHVAPDGAEPVAGGAALAEILRAIGPTRPLAGILDRTPAASERAYRLVAENRSRLSRFVPGAAKRRADALVRARSG